MARHNICLIHGHDAELLAKGAELKCSEHKHVDRSSAQLMASGTQIRPFLDPDHNPHKGLDQMVSERWKPTAAWAKIPHFDCDGFGCADCQGTGLAISNKHLVVFSARNWQVEGGSMQYLLLGATQQPRKRGRTHLKSKYTGTRAGFTINRRVDTTQTPEMLAKAVCRPSLLRKQA